MRGCIYRRLAHDGVGHAEARWAILDLSRKVGLGVEVDAKPFAQSTLQGLSRSSHPARLHLGNVSGPPGLGGGCLAPGWRLLGLEPPDTRSSAQVYLL